MTLLAVSGAEAQTVIVDDSFADGITNNGLLQIGFNVTSTLFALDLNQAPGPLDFATGNSGRTIHGIFPKQTLAEFGDVLTVTFVFITPTSIGNDNGFPSINEDFKFGLFDTSNSNLNFNGPIISSFSNPNPGLIPLAGFFGEIDNINAPGTDLGIRTNNVNGVTSIPLVSPQSGVFLTSNTGFDFISDGTDNVISLVPNSSYTGTLNVEFSDASLTALEITVGVSAANGDFVDSHTDVVSIADTPGVEVGVNTTSFDMFALHATSGAFGGTDGPAAGSSVVGEPNNGIDIENVRITFTDIFPTLKGDVDLNTEVTFFDISPFIAILFVSGFQEEADCNCDGDVDFLDVQPFINILTDP